MIDVGYVARPHGLRGEVVVVLTTDRQERVEPGTRLSSDSGPLVVESSRGQRNQPSSDQTSWIVRFDGIADREAADRLRGQVLRAEPLDDPDELWVHELVGSDVVLAADESSVGKCVAVVSNPAADLLELESGALVPVVFVVERNEDRVVIDPPPGLFDL